jgi:histone acetyltransferase 1
MNDSTIVELTVEDPSEEFDKLRDMNDFDVLEPQFKAAGISINTSPFESAPRGRVKRVPTSTLLPNEKLKQIQTKNKIANRQFARMVEMYLLAQIPHTQRSSGGASLTSLMVKGARAKDPNDRAYYWWRLLLKQRIMKKNKDLLQQIPLEDRVPQIEDSARAQEDEYEGLILTYGLRRDKGANRQGNDEPSAPSRKRKIVESDEDESDGIEGTKRSRF